jgi:hypothetical protein
VVTKISKEHITSVLRVEMSQNGDIRRLYRRSIANVNREKRKKGKGKKKVTEGP